MRNEKFTMILTGTRRGLQAVPRKFALSCLLFLLPLLHAYSQRSGLGKDSDDFSSYLLQYLVSDPNLDKDTKEYLEEAVPGYLAFYAALDKNVREEVASLARSSYKARLKPYPGLWDFLQVQRQMQEQLNVIAGAYPALPKIDADGIYGPATADAVKKFQDLFVPEAWKV